MAFYVAIDAGFGKMFCNFPRSPITLLSLPRTLFI